MPASNLQDVALRLTRFWVEEGCRLVAPSDLPLGAAVHHPQIFFALLDGTPQRLTVLQPVRRPRDGRHGNQPYRLARHLQLEVLLTPAPDDLLALFLRSLRAIGFQVDRHDVRFAEGRWRSVRLGAEGRGWNVRVDGMGIARVTLPQAALGTPLATISAEITYGVERLVTSLAAAPSAYDIAWHRDGPDYGSLHREDEAEASAFAFTVADPEILRRRLRDHRAEAEACLAAALPRSAYEAAMRAAFELELLSARGALASVERQAEASAIAELVARAAPRSAPRQSPRPTGAETGDGG